MTDHYRPSYRPNWPGEPRRDPVAPIEIQRDFTELSCEAKVVLLTDRPEGFDDRVYCGEQAVGETGGLIPVCDKHLRLYRHALGFDPDTGSPVPLSSQ